MKNLLTLCFVLLFSFNAFAQDKTYYVKTNTLNIRQEPNTESSKIETLKKYDNIKVIEIVDKNWAKIQTNNIKGYVWSEYIEEGRAIVTYTEYRTGAKCNDGTTSSATGRGACSHHGGVNYWLTKKNKSVRFEDN